MLVRASSMRSCGTTVWVRAIDASDSGLAENLLGALEQDPARRDVLVAALGAVAAVGVGECRRRDQQRAGLRRDPARLVQELRLAGLERVVEVERPQHVPVQGFALRIARIQLA